jgi:hypothetical protein
MRSHWIIAALLSSALAAGCNGRNNDNSQNTEQNGAAAPANAPATTDQTVAPAPSGNTQQPYTSADNSAVRTQPSTTAPRATTGRRDAPRSSAPSRTEPAPQANSTYNNSANNSASNASGVGLPPRESNRAAAAPAPRLPEYREITVPAGTALPLEMTSSLSSESAQVEAPVSARLRNALTINGNTAIPAGSIVRGTVTDVERAGRVQGRAHLSFAFNEVSMNGGREDLKTNPLTFEAEATKGEDATKVGAGAVGGAILGGILGGKKGAAKGAAGGAAAGTGVVLATRGKEVTVAEGTDVTATLAQPMTIRVRVP